MARKVKEPKASKNSPEKDLLLRVRDRFKVMTEADEENRRRALEDLRFLNVPGEQWEQWQKLERGKDRVCYEFNKLRVTVKRIVNDMRANRPQGKVRGVEDGDKDTADTLEGLCRNIWNTSDGDTVADYAGEYQVGGGMGAWRIDTEYSDDTAFDQDIRIKPIKNPFCLYADPSCSDPLKRDAADWILTERIALKTYEAKYPKAEKIDFEDVEFDDEDEWEDGETVRIVEYWYKEPYRKEIWLLSDGKAIDASQPEAAQIPPEMIKRKRSVVCDKIMMCVASGSAVLEGPTEWAGPDFPFVIVYGEWLVIDGKVYWHGLTRFSKDAQRGFNVAQTSVVENVAMAPLAPYWATTEQAKGNLDKWAEAHKKLFPVMLYNPDPKAPGPPQRMGSADVPIALIQITEMMSENIKSTSGIFDPSLGQRSNETSGKAIAARQAQGEIATFNYSDNMAKAIRRTWEILINLIPKIYETERSVRILGVDGAEKYTKVNSSVVDQTTGLTKPLNDLSRGKYDVTVTVGPSFSTQRQEATELYTQLGQAVPQVWGVAGDLIFKSMDLPYAEQIAERMRAILPPQIQQQLSEGKQIPPEAQAVMAQAAQAMQIVQQQTQLVQAAAQEAEQNKAESDKAKAEVQQLIAQLETKKAQFEAFMAKQLAQLAQKELQSATKGAEAGSEQDRASLAAEVQQAIAAIREMAAQFMQASAQTLAEIQSRNQPQIIVANPPKRRQVRVRREQGELVGEIQEVPDLVQ